MPVPDARPSASSAGASAAGAWPATWPPSRRPAAARIARCLDEAAAGHGCAMVLSGEPGIGRTTMLNQVVAQASGRFLIARACGYAHGSEAPGVVLAELLRQLGPAAETPVDAVATGSALLARLDAARRPVLITVDDAQWLDAGSLDVLARLARRLDGRRALLLIAVRSGTGVVGARPAALRGLPGIVLDRLTDEESAELIGRSAGRPGGDLHRLAAGNPLALELFGAGVLPGLAPGDAELRLRLTDLFAGELDHLSPAARETLAEIAVRLGDADAPGPGWPVCTSPAGAELEAAGLLLHNAGRWRLAHPLLASAALVDVAPARLRELHALAAAALGGDPAPGAAIRRIRHRVAAADGQDDGLAAEIEALVRDGELEMETVGRLLISAASLGSEPAGRLRRLLAGIGALQGAGLFTEADAHAARADDLAGTPADRVALADLRLDSEAVTGRPACARDALLRLAADTADTDPEGAAERYRRSALLSVGLGETDLAQAALAHAGRLAATSSGPSGDAVTRVVGVLTGTVPASAERRGGAAGGAAVPAAWARALTGDLPGALGSLESATDAARRRSAHGILPGRLIALSGLRLASGRVAGALAAADEALRLARTTGATAIAPRALLALARAEAVTGREQDCRAHVEEAMAWCRAEQDTSLLVQASGVLGFLALSLGDHAEALAHLEANPPVGLVEDAVLPWPGDLVEALVRTGARAQAGQVLAETEATGRTPPALRCALERGRGLLADDAEPAAAYLAEAVRTARTAGLPIEEARSLTLLGEVLAGRDAAAARRSILAGAALFDRLGALRWRARAQQLLGDARPGRTGASRPSGPEHAASPSDAPGGPDLTLLTTQELRVARLAADGLTNQQVAGALFLSVRTVEFHLSNAYRKLQVNRRAQLVRLIAAGDAAESGQR